jgi:hypothetical protein
VRECYFGAFGVIVSAGEGAGGISKRPISSSNLSDFQIVSQKQGTKFLVLAFSGYQAFCRRFKFRWLPLLRACCEGQMSGDRCARADLQAISNGKPGPGGIDDLVLYLFSDAIQSEIGSAPGPTI